MLSSFEFEFVVRPDDADFVITHDKTAESGKPSILLGSSPATNHELEQSLWDDRNGLVELSSEILLSSSEIFDRVFSPRVSQKYSVLTRLPIQYNFVPVSIRSRVLKSDSMDSNLIDHLANELTLRLFLTGMEIIGFSPKRKRPAALHVTHDIDSEKGLQRAVAMKRIEEKVGVGATWFVVSDEYDISRKIARELSSGSSIGSHDTRHDGKLIHLKDNAKLMDRLRRSKETLENLFETQVRSFRSPLLQFNRGLLRALTEAGYDSDFSLPCWEPSYPSTMGGFGVEYAHPFVSDSVTEYPLTLFQDHQVFYLMRLSPDHAIKLWNAQAEVIEYFGGDLVLLVHPDYTFGQDLACYEELLRSLIENELLKVGLPVA